MADTTAGQDQFLKVVQMILDGEPGADAAAKALTDEVEAEQVLAIREKPLHQLAAEIRVDWKNVYFGAVPYIDAMSCLNSIDDDYGLDPGREIVVYFLSNARSWRGEKAREIKAELKRRLAR